MAIDVEQEIALTVRGDIDERAKSIARKQVAAVCAHVHEPVLFAEVKLRHEPDPARARPYQVEAVLTLSRATLRAHVAAESQLAALDLLEDRLRRRIDRYTTSRTASRRTGPRPHTDGDGSWHHGDLATQRPAYFSRPVEERELVRHKTVAVGEMTPDEAADLLDLLGHDFVLFTNLVTGADAVLAYDRGDSLELIDASGRADAAGADSVTPIDVGKDAVRRCTLADALEELDLDLAPFVFFVDPEVGRGQVTYHRYDGHYGLITPA
ncbi:MAG: HPF/RaiA family ribosome-associated protein [Actinobacteria bacterium]|nr:HPF/RaiA family ribosome-associated protein [Actinomycetota bacterium]